MLVRTVVVEPAGSHDCVRESAGSHEPLGAAVQSCASVARLYAPLRFVTPMLVISAILEVRATQGHSGHYVRRRSRRSPRQPLLAPSDPSVSTTASTPSTAGGSVSGRVTSPTIHPQPLVAAFGLLPRSRASARVVYPCRIASSTTRRPMLPVAPTTRTGGGTGDHSVLSRLVASPLTLALTLRSPATYAVVGDCRGASCSHDKSRLDPTAGSGRRSCCTGQRSQGGAEPR